MARGGGGGRYDEPQCSTGARRVAVVTSARRTGGEGGRRETDRLAARRNRPGRCFTAYARRAPALPRAPVRPASYPRRTD